MPQVFHRSINTIARLTIILAAAALAGLGWGLYEFFYSSLATGANVVYLQPIPFSHQHHVGQLGFDCRYCHTSVEQSSFAGIPPTKTCMNCHSQIWVGSPLLEPVRESYRTGRPIAWQRVHNLQEFVYFDHHIHIHKGVGCATCHGRVDKMPLVHQDQSLLMQWCLDCHRNPQQYVRPREQVFSMDWTPEKDGTSQSTLGPALVQQYRIRDENTLTSCSVCHR